MWSKLCIFWPFRARSTGSPSFSSLLRRPGSDSTTQCISGWSAIKPYTCFNLQLGIHRMCKNHAVYLYFWYFMSSFREEIPFSHFFGFFHIFLVVARSKTHDFWSRRKRLLRWRRSSCSWHVLPPSLGWRLRELRPFMDIETRKCVMILSLFFSRFCLKLFTMDT